MASISQLLKYKDWIMLVDTEGNQIKKIWLRVVGDEDLKESFGNARKASAELRSKLLTAGTDEYNERILPIMEGSHEDCVEIILTSRSQNLMAEATSATKRPDLPKIEEIAIDADAPTLQEQEELDAKIKEIDAAYEKAIADFIQDRRAVIKAEWDDKSLEEVRLQAEIEASAIMALGEFINVLDEEKCWRSIFEDEACKIRGFSDLADFRSSDTFIKEQVIEAYRKLEMGPDEIKNWRKAILGE